MKCLLQARVWTLGPKLVVLAGEVAEPCDVRPSWQREASKSGL